MGRKAFYPGELESGYRLTGDERTRAELNRTVRTLERLGRRDHLAGPCRHTRRNPATGDYETKVLDPKREDHYHEEPDPLAEPDPTDI